jgi:hypothetical protein
MQQIDIKLWHHSEQENWTIEIDGKLHQHVSTKTVDDLGNVLSSPPRKL